MAAARLEPLSAPKIVEISTPGAAKSGVIPPSRANPLPLCK